MSSPYPPHSPQPAAPGPAAPPAYGAAYPPGHDRPAPGAPASRSASNPLGLASAIVGLAIVLLEIVMQFVRTALIAGDGSIDAIAASSTVQGVLVIVLGLVALALGIIALFQRGRSKILAVVGVTIGGHALLAWATSLLSNLMLSVL